VLPVEWWLSVLLVLVLSVVLVPLVRLYALRAGLVDHPGPRRSHHEVTPRGGGLAIVLAAGLGLYLLPLPGVWKIGFLGALAAIAVLGFVEDHRSIPVMLRLVFQMLVALVLVACLGGISALPLAGDPVFAPWLWNPLALIGLVWMINLHNFMDGSDGLAATQGVSCGLLFAFAFAWTGFPLGSAMALCVAAGYLGFLPWNLSRPGFFMGDVGSMSLGLLLGMLVLTGILTDSVPVWTSILVTSVFVVDATATLLNRMFTRGQWYTPHREHAYQRLIELGWSHGRVCLLYAGTNWLIVAPALLLSLAWPEWGPVLALITVLLLVLSWFVVQGVTKRTSIVN